MFRSKTARALSFGRHPCRFPDRAQGSAAARSGAFSIRGLMWQRRKSLALSRWSAKAGRVRNGSQPRPAPATRRAAMFLRLLHRLLEIFLHLERRIEQPFLRPAFNSVFRMPMAAALTWLQNIGAEPGERGLGRGDAATRRGAGYADDDRRDAPASHARFSRAAGSSGRATPRHTASCAASLRSMTACLRTSAAGCLRRRRPIAAGCRFSGPRAAYRARHQRCRFRQHQRQGHGRAGRKAVGRRKAHAGLHLGLHAGLRHPERQVRTRGCNTGADAICRSSISSTRARRISSTS